MTRWAKFGAAWLLGVGVLLASLLAYGFVEGIEAGFDPMDGLVIVVFSTVTALHIAAGAGVWWLRRHGGGPGIRDEGTPAVVGPSREAPACSVSEMDRGES